MRPSLFRRLQKSLMLQLRHRAATTVRGLSLHPLSANFLIPGDDLSPQMIRELFLNS